MLQDPPPERNNRDDDLHEISSHKERRERLQQLSWRGILDGSPWQPSWIFVLYSDSVYEVYTKYLKRKVLRVTAITTAFPVYLSYRWGTLCPRWTELCVRESYMLSSSECAGDKPANMLCGKSCTDGAICSAGETVHPKTLHCTYVRFTRQT